MKLTLEITKENENVTFQVLELMPPIFKKRIDFNKFVEQLKTDENVILNEGVNMLHFNIRLSKDKKEIIRYWQ
jgi:hypothetical protein